MPRPPVPEPAEKPETTPAHTPSLAAVSFLSIIGLALATRGSIAEFERQFATPIGSILATAGAIAVGVGLFFFISQSRRFGGFLRASSSEAEALGFTLLAIAIGGLVGIVGATESIRNWFVSGWDIPALLLLILSITPLLLLLAITSALAAHVAAMVSGWYHAADLRVLVISIVAAITGSVTPLGRQGVLVVAPLALFLAAFVVIVRRPPDAIRAKLELANSRASRVTHVTLVISGLVGILMGAAISVQDFNRDASDSLPEVLIRRWDVGRVISGPAEIAMCDLISIDSPTLLVENGADVADAGAPLLAVRLARAARSSGRVLFEMPCAERLIRRARRELRRDGAFPPAFEIRFQDSAGLHSLVAVGFDIPQWLDARPLPSEYHPEFVAYAGAGPRVEE